MQHLIKKNLFHLIVFKIAEEGGAYSNSPHMYVQDIYVYTVYIYVKSCKYPMQA